MPRRTGSRFRARQLVEFAWPVVVIAAVLAIAVAEASRTDRGTSSRTSDRALPVGAADEALPGEPRPVSGVALGSGSGLQLLVALRRPIVLDVDRGTVTAVRGVPVVRRGVLSVVAVGGKEAAIVVPTGSGPRIYGLTSHDATAVRLGPGRAVVPDPAHGAVWIHAKAAPGHCTLRGVNVAGGATLAARSFPCAATIDSGGALRIVVNRTVLYDVRTVKVVLRPPGGVVAAAGTTLVLKGEGRTLKLFDVPSRRQSRVKWPSRLGLLDAAAVDGRGWFVALAFADPSWSGTGKQVLDLWLLDSRTGQLTHVPGMPALVALKYTSLSWTDDGRLVLLGRSTGRDLVAVWRPGQRRLHVKTVRIPARSSGSDSFAPIR